MKLLEAGRWLGYSASTSDEDACEAAALRLGCDAEELEIVRDAIVKVRRKDAETSFATIE